MSIMFRPKTVNGFALDDSRILGEFDTGEYNGPAEPVRQFMLSQAPNSTE